ncbi:MAG TPA: hypothetical protein VJ608_10715 [Albitalea sp.]|nr:hypothetical protein [Albitalea sp.]
MSSTASPRVLAVLDDAAAGQAVLELSSALARAVQRDLALVYVESTQSLVAAALPFARVLSHAATQWVPLLPQDVEQGYRAQAARLRVLAERISVRDAVSWSLRVVRGSLPGAALELLTESDLLLVAANPPRQRRRHVIVAAVDDATPAGGRALRVAAQLARALGGSLQTAHVDPALAQPDILVLPSTSFVPGALAKARCPVLLVA